MNRPVEMSMSLEVVDTPTAVAYTYAANESAHGRITSGRHLGHRTAGEVPMA